MDTRKDELEAFKQKIDLRDYAAAQGFEEDRRASGVNSTGMKHPDGDKIIIGMGHDDHWIYFSVHDPADNGSIIDFVQNRQGLNLGGVRQELRKWLTGQGTFTPPLSRSTTPRLKPVVTDLSAVRAAYEAAQPVADHHPYLCDVRSIPASVLASKRFAGRIRSDPHGNALFPHWNADKKLCGFEKKNDGFTGFSSGGTKGLWCSNAQDQDRRLVIAETAIDALSYAALFGFDDTRFFSIAGQMNPQQPGLINRAIRAAPAPGPPGAFGKSQVILAVDHDDGGQMIAEYIEPIFKHVHDTLGRDDLELVIHRPEIHGQDWNDVLCTDPDKRDARPTAPGTPGAPGASGASTGPA